MTTIRLLAACPLLLLLAAATCPAAAPPCQAQPLSGAVVAGRAVACVMAQDACFWSQPFAGGKATEVDFLALAPRRPLRWHVGHGGFWVNDSAHGDDILQSYELDRLLAGSRILGPGAKPTKYLGDSFAFPMAIADARFLARHSDFELVLHHDSVPTARDAVTVFVLTNLGGRSTDLGNGVSVLPRYGKQEWSFRFYTCATRWDKGKDTWVGWHEELGGSIDLAFREPFQALARGEEYYFLTDSGRLFRAPKPAKGKHRKVEAIWDDRKAPIVAFVTDADKGRTFLFCDKGPKGVAGPCVFELASDARVRLYDKKLFEPGEQGPNELRRVVGYARVLESLGYVKARDAKDAKKGEAGRK